MHKFAAMFKARSMEFLRDRGSLFWNLFFPFVLVFGFAIAFSGGQRDVFKVGMIGTPAKQAPFLKLDGIQFITYDPSRPDTTKESVLKSLREHKIDMLLDFDSGRYYINSQSVKGPLLKRLLVAGGGGTNGLGLAEQQISGRPVRYVDWLVPGVIGMNMLFGCMFGVGFVIVRYRKNGVLKRLNASPVSAFNFVTAQAASRLVIVLATSFVVYEGANLFLHFMMLGSYLNLILLTALAAISMISLGLIFAARMRSEELANGLMNLITFPMVVFSGVFFSLEGTPLALQKVAQAFPLTHFVNAARSIMLDGSGIGQVWPDFLFLAGFSAVFLLISSLTFRWE